MLPLHHTKFSVFNYNEIPEGYYFRAMTQGRPVQRFWHRFKFMEVASKIPNGSNVLDFGCGPGSFLSVLAERNDQCMAIGADIASIQIDFAQREIGDKIPGRRVQFVKLQGDEKRLPFADATFDVITCIEVVEHLHPYLAMRALQEMRRVLKPSGKILITTPNYRSLWPLVELGLEVLSPVKYHDQHISKFTPNALLKFIETAGLEVTNLSSLFVASPFLSALSWAMAEKLFAVEKSALPRAGCLLLAEAQPVFFEK